MLEITQDNNPLQVLEEIIPALECLERLNEFDHWPFGVFVTLALSLGFAATLFSPELISNLAVTTQGVELIKLSTQCSSHGETNKLIKQEAHSIPYY